MALRVDEWVVGIRSSLLYFQLRRTLTTITAATTVISNGCIIIVTLQFLRVCVTVTLELLMGHYAGVFDQVFVDFRLEQLVHQLFCIPSMYGDLWSFYIGQLQTSRTLWGTPDHTESSWKHGRLQTRIILSILFCNKSIHSFFFTYSSCSVLKIAKLLGVKYLTGMIMHIIRNQHTLPTPSEIKTAWTIWGAENRRKTSEITSSHQFIPYNLNYINIQRYAHTALQIKPRWRHFGYQHHWPPKR
jgi:hypothetical protein